MAKKNIITDPDVAEETVEVATDKPTAVKAAKTPAVKTAKTAAPSPSPEVPVKPKLSAAQIKALLKDYSKVTLKARGII
jgi:hypothetical protein